MIDGYSGHEHAFPIYPLYKDFQTAVAQSKMAYTPTLLVAYGGPWGENYYYATENVNSDPKLNHFTAKSNWIKSPGDGQDGLCLKSTFFRTTRNLSMRS